MMLGRTVMLLVAVFAHAEASAAPALLDRVVAQVNGEPILLSQLSEEEQQQGAGVPRAETLDKIIGAVLLEQEAKRIGLDPPTEMIAEAVDERLEQIRTNWPDESTFDAYLESEGLTLAELRQNLREDEARAWLRRSLVVARLGAPPAEMGHAEYDLAQIVIACAPDASDALVKETYDQCLSFRARVLQGEDFGQLASAFSDDLHSAALGGAIGRVELRHLDPGIAEAVEDLNEGDLSVPVRTDQGWHLLAVRHVTSPRQRWFMEEFERKREELVRELWRQGRVETYLD